MWTVEQFREMEFKCVDSFKSILNLLISSLIVCVQWLFLFVDDLHFLPPLFVCLIDSATSHLGLETGTAEVLSPQSKLCVDLIESLLVRGRRHKL